MKSGGVSEFEKMARLNLNRAVKSEKKIRKLVSELRSRRSLSGITVISKIENKF